jgi:hypothetical protein
MPATHHTVPHDVDDYHDQHDDDRAEASHQLEAASKAAKKAARGKNPKLSADCAAAITPAAGTQRDGLRSH